MKCCFCGKRIEDFECNNPSPVNNDEDAVCCNKCNNKIVVPRRLKLLMGYKKVKTNE